MQGCMFPMGQIPVSHIRPPEFAVCGGTGGSTAPHITQPCLSGNDQSVQLPFGPDFLFWAKFSEEL